MFKFLASFLLTSATQAKKEFLSNKYDLDMLTIESLEGLDPTHGVYLEWLAREKSKGAEATKNITYQLSEFEKLKRNPAWSGNRDILSYNYTQFEELISSASREDYSKKQKVRDIEENAKKYIDDGVEYLGKVVGCYCYQATKAPGLVAMSQGTHWCTKGESTADSYLKNGQVYVFTKSEFENTYGNDKYALLAVQAREGKLSYLEAETAEGIDLSSTRTPGVIYTEECMEMVKFVATFNETLQVNQDKLSVDERMTACSNCGTHTDEDDGYTFGDNMYCEDCYYEFFTQCRYCGADIDKENERYISTDEEDLCSDCGEYCSRCHGGYAIKGRGAVSFFEIPDEHRSVCESCFYDDYFNCEGCDENFSNDNRYGFNDMSLCGTCYKNDWDRGLLGALKEWGEPIGATIEKDVRAELKTEAEEPSDLTFALEVLSNRMLHDQNIESKYEMLEWLHSNGYIDANDQYIPGQSYQVV